MAIVDETVVAVALPSIQADLGLSTSRLSWVVDGYLIGFGGVLLLAGRVGDLIGRRRVLLTGMIVFSVASAACAAAPSSGLLIAARFVQGLGGSLASAVALGMVSALFEDERVRTRAMGIYAMVSAIGASIGLFLGGVITAVAGWRWAFGINVPIGLVTVLVGRHVLPRDRGPGLRSGADALGAALLVGGVMSAIAAIVQEPAFAGPAVLLLALFMRRQAKAKRPLLPLAIFRDRVVAGVNAAHALMVGAMFGFQFLMTLYLQRALGYSPAEAGLGLLPIAVGIGITSLIVFPRVRRVRVAYPAGLAAVLAGMVLLVRVPVDGDYAVDVLPSALLFALGGGFALPAAMTLAMSKATQQTAGAISGLINTSQQVGGALGLAVLATVAAHRSSSLGGHQASALVGGFQLAWTLGSLLVLAALTVGIVALRERRTQLATKPRISGASETAGAEGTPQCESKPA